MTTQTVEQVIMGLMQEFAEDWGLDIELTKTSKLKGDIGFDSSDTMQLFAAIQESYKSVPFKFQDLVMKDEKFVDDLTIGQVTAFVIKSLSGK